MSQEGKQGQLTGEAGQGQALAAVQPQGADMATQQQQQQQAAFGGMGGEQSQGGAPAAQAGGQNSAAALKGMGIDSSSSAVLDACMRDLTRRRIAMAEAARYATGNPATPSNLLAGLAGPGFDFNMATLGMQASGMRRASLGMEPLPHEDPAQQLRRISMTFNSQLGQQFPQQQPGPGLEHLAQPCPPANPAQPPAGASPRQWWVCRVCQSKAFASAEEASEHEALCNQEGATPPPKPPAAPEPQPAQQPHLPQDAPPQPGATTTAPMQQMDPAAMSHLYPFLSATGVPQAQPQQPFNINISQDDVKSEMERFFQKQQEKIRQMQSLTASATSTATTTTTPTTTTTTTTTTIKKDDKPAQAATSAQEPTPIKQDTSNMSQVLPLPDEASQELPNPQTKPLEGSADHATLQEALPLAMPNDKDWLTPLHCFVRRHCVEVFTATPTDVATPSKGKRKPIQVGQVGIRCPHCHPHKYPYMNRNGQVHHPRERGSVYYPTTIASIYNATMNLLQRHLHSCSSVPHDVMARYAELKADDARSGTSKKYWVDSAKSLGLIDTNKGIFFSSLRPPPLPSLSQQQFRTVVSSAGRRNSLDFFSSKSNAQPPKQTSEAQNDGKKEGGAQDSNLDNSEPLVSQKDRATATGFSFELLSQMQPCVFTEADRLGKRKGLPPGFAGLACRHCFGGYGSGRFFPSSIKTLSDTSKTLNVLHNHMIRCRKCPREVRDRLEKLRITHDDERAKMKFGSQKAFFAQIWARLHDGKDNADGLVKSQRMRAQQQIRKEVQSSQQAIQLADQHQQQLSMQQQIPPQLFQQQANITMAMSAAMAAANTSVGPNPAVSAGAKRNAAAMSVPQLPSSGDMKRMRASGA